MLNHNVAWEGGTFFRAYHFAQNLTRRGHQVTLLTISPHLRYGFHVENNNGICIVETPDLLWGRARSGWDLWGTLNRLLYIAQHSYDLVHAFDSRPEVILPALFCRKRNKSPLVLDWADWWGRGGTTNERDGSLTNLLIAPIETFFEEAFRTSADGNTVISTALYRRAMTLNVRPATLLHLMQGCDTEKIQRLEHAKAKELLGLPSSGPLIGHLGVLQPRDAKFLFSFFEQLKQTEPTACLIIIGRHRCNLEKYKRENKGWFETGPLNHEKKVLYLAASDILLLPLADTLANRARWPSRVNDYLAAGRPVVATAVGDVADMLQAEGAGIVTSPHAEDFLDGVLTLVRSNDLRRSLGDKSRALAETKLSWSHITDGLENYYKKSLLSGRNYLR
jgi:glycosyltransferase involved in cell wall biosynthesis